MPWINLTEEGKAYIAGLFDGEGCVNINIRRGGKKAELTVAITNLHVGVLKYVQSHFGGRLSNVGNKKATPDWRCESNKAVSFLKVILPYLIIKKEQAKKDDYQERIEKLNKNLEQIMGW